MLSSLINFETHTSEPRGSLEPTTQQNTKKIIRSVCVYALLLNATFPQQMNTLLFPVIMLFYKDYDIENNIHVHLRG